MGINPFNIEFHLNKYSAITSTVSRTTLGLPPTLWVPGALSTGVKLSWHEVDNLPSSTGEDKNA
jgi:hypothetical protein